MQRVSQSAEPFPLIRRSHARDTYTSWFGRHRVTRGSVVTAVSISPSPVVVVVKEGELRPATAGAIVGGIGGVVMLAASMLVARQGGSSLDVFSMIGHSASRGAATSNTAFGLGVALSVVAGAVVGGLFARLTRRLRYFAPLMAFGLVLTTASWILVDALALPKIAPGLARALPFAPMTIGAALFGLILSLELPLRTRRFA